MEDGCGWYTPLQVADTAARLLTACMQLNDWADNTVHSTTYLMTLSAPHPVGTVSSHVLP